MNFDNYLGMIEKTTRIKENKDAGVIYIHSFGKENKINNEEIISLVSNDFDFEEIELINDISIPDLINTFFFKKYLRYIQYVNNNKKIRYGFMFEVGFTRYINEEPDFFSRDINFFLELNKQTNSFSFHSGFNETHDNNIKLASALVKSEKKEITDRKILISEDLFLISNAINGSVIIEKKIWRKIK